MTTRTNNIAQEMQSHESAITAEPSYVDKKTYTTSQISTYMGNKRKLLPFIEEALIEIKKELPPNKPLTIGDGFSGSGVVSRLFKTMATELYVNDLAGYSHTFNTCYLATPSKTMMVQIKSCIDEANKKADEATHTPLVRVTDRWISQHWAPQNPTITPSDRAYFTCENGRRIDVMRNYIETLPSKMQPYILAPLLVESSIHNNTNGQFSAFYKDKDGKKGEYGGKTKTDIKRITQEIRIPYPIFDKSKCKTHVTQTDATEWAKTLPNEIDVVYYDPPYNKHPYNIYYFLLDIINDWDKTLEIPDTNRGQPDTRTKSKYNSVVHAKVALTELIANTPAKYIMLSYNDGGIISIPDLDKLLAIHSKSVKKIPIDHKTYNRLKGISNYKRTTEYKPVKEYLYIIQRTE
jgi:adenine-specific DNA-methyltransferase